MQEKIKKTGEKKPDKKTTITFNISHENKKALKIYAAEKETTISAVVTEWVEKYCLDKKR